MPVFDPIYLFLALILVVPGFIAAFIGVTLGVVERRISNAKWIIVSLVSSLIILSIFLTIIELFGGRIENPEAIVSLFFEPVFRVQLVALLFAISIGLGVVYAYLLAKNIHARARDFIWRGSDRKRNPWQPWEGAMKNAHIVQIVTKDNQLVAGELDEYSRAGRNRQIVLSDAAWYEANQDNPDNPKPEAAKELFFGDEIKQVSILMTEEEKERWNGDLQKDTEEATGSEQ